MQTATKGYATQAEIQSALMRNGASNDQARVLSAIAYAESSGYTGANNNYKGNSYQGLFQIGQFWGTDYSKIHSDDLDYQAQFAMKVLDQQGITAWQTYTTGAYKKYLDQNSAALPTKADLGDFSDITGAGAGEAAAGEQAATGAPPLLAATDDPLSSPQGEPKDAPSAVDTPGSTGSPLDTPGTETVFGNPLDSPLGFDKALQPSGV